MTAFLSSHSSGCVLVGAFRGRRVCSLKRPRSHGSTVYMRQPLSDPENPVAAVNIRARLLEVESQLKAAVSSQRFKDAAALRDEMVRLRASDPTLSLRDALSAAVAQQDFGTAARLRDELAALTESLSRSKSPNRVNRILLLSARGSSPETPVLRVGTVAPDGSNVIMFPSSDPTFNPSSLMQKIYLQPTWSPSGDYIAVTEVSFQVRRTRGIITETSSRVVVFDAFNASVFTSCETEKPPFFYSWSPCGTKLSLLASETGRNYAALYTLQVVAPKGGFGDAEGSEIRSLKGPMSSGRPFLYDFCPRDAGIVVAHIRDDVKNVVATVSLEGKGVRLLTSDGGAFGTPQWHPLARKEGGECVLFVEEEKEVGVRLITNMDLPKEIPGVGKVVEGRFPQSLEKVMSSQKLIMCDVETGQRKTICTFSGIMSFGLSPDGQKLAIMVTNAVSGQEELSIRMGDFSPDIVDEAHDREANSEDRVVEPDIILSTPATRVLAFFWSPDSSKLLYLTAQRGNSNGVVQWCVFDMDTKRITRFAKFRPSGVFLTNFLTFFDQFSATGSSPWSPESNAFAYPGRALGADDGETVGSNEGKGLATGYSAWVQYLKGSDSGDGEPPPPVAVAPNVEFACWSPC